MSLVAHYIDMTFGDQHVDPERAAAVLALSARRLKNRWADDVEQDKAGLARLRPGTVAKKRKAGMHSPETPLVGTGKLMDDVRRWQIVTSIEKDGNDLVVKAGTGPRAQDDMECIVKDQLTGSEKANIPARPLSPRDSDVERESDSWALLMSSGPADREVYTDPRVGFSIDGWSDYRRSGYYGL